MFVEYYNQQRHHEILSNLTQADVDFGRGEWSKKSLSNAGIYKSTWIFLNFNLSANLSINKFPKLSQSI